jgi:hypothetical protein
MKKLFEIHMESTVYSVGETEEEARRAFTNGSDMYDNDMREHIMDVNEASSGIDQDWADERPYGAKNDPRSCQEWFNDALAKAKIAKEKAEWESRQRTLPIFKKENA